MVFFDMSLFIISFFPLFDDPLFQLSYIFLPFPVFIYFSTLPLSFFLFLFPIVSYAEAYQQYYYNHHHHHHKNRQHNLSTFLLHTDLNTRLTRILLMYISMQTLIITLLTVLPRLIFRLTADVVIAFNHL